jgi:superfamily II DNA or RNA helicase
MFESITFPFELKPYQKEAVAMLLAKKHGVVLMPTGTGKTVIGIEGMRRINMRTAVIVPTEVMLNQWVRNLKKAGVMYPGVFYGKEKRHGSSVTVFIINSAANHPEALRDYGFIIVDEVHHVAAEDFSDKLLPVLKIKPYVLGLTSWLKRSDGREVLVTRIAPVIYTMPLAQAMKDKHVSNLKIYTVRALMTIRERQQYDKYTETIRKAFFIFKTLNPAVLTKSGSPLAIACLAALSKRKILLSNIVSKKDKVLKIVKFYPQERILVFTESIVGANALFTHLTLNQVASGIYHSGVDSKIKERSLEKWKSKDNICKTMIACRCLDEGVDVPECRIGIIVASGSNTRQWIQRVGRLIRKRFDNSSGALFIVYCEGTIEARYSKRLLHIIRTK